ncbi:MAG: histidine kinase [Clostridia bacterium]|nr:histidine kinase [Clostridia bacterium]
MTDAALLYSYIFAGGALLLLVLLGLAAAATMPGLEKTSRRFFIASFSVLALSIASYLVDLFAYSDPDLVLIEKIAAFFETFLPSLLMPLLTVYVLHCCKEELRKSALFYIEIGFLSVLLILLCVTQFTESIYYFTPDNQFVRGEWYPVLILPMGAMIVANLVGVIRRRQELTKKRFVAFLIYLLPLLIAIVSQAFVTVFLLIVIAVTISALSMFGIIMADQVEQYLRQQREIAGQRARIAVLQMRPHFIYNTMMSIYYLCEQDQKKAQQVVLDFTDYLRKNFGAIAGEDTIPFSEELEHTRAYLAVEQAQFEDRLTVEYDTPYTHFRLPPLTLQPIVENAVKHGMDPNEDEPLFIVVKTEKTDGGALITVEDNGNGFDPSYNSESFTALDNICERLKQQCGGTLKIDSTPGKTTVTIFIPIKK